MGATVPNLSRYFVSMVACAEPSNVARVEVIGVTAAREGASATIDGN